MKATDFLNKAKETIGQRGKDYDSEEGKRSAGKAAIAFNAITGKDITEPEAWLFLQILKDVRQWQKPEYHYDSALDCVSYAALKAEALSPETPDKRTCSRCVYDKIEANKHPCCICIEYSAFVEKKEE